MAVTITRSVWIDDDGTGQSGTVINQALHTTLYNEIDTALAKVAQLAGGNVFTGNQTVNGTLVVQSAAVTALPVRLQVVSNQTSQWGIGINTTADSVGGIFIGFLNAAGAVQGAINASSSTVVAYNTTSDARLKTDRGVAHDLAALRAVVVHDFTWTADGIADRGVFAQDAHALYPRAVSPGTDARTARGTLSQPWQTDYSKFVPDLIVGWQQHDAALTELRALLATVAG